MINNGASATFTSGPAAMLHSVAPGPRRRRHVGHSAQRPEHDLVRLPAHLPAGQRMAKLVHQHDHEQGQVFQHRPNHRGIRARPACLMPYTATRNQTSANTHQSPQSGTGEWTLAVLASCAMT